MSKIIYQHKNNGVDRELRQLLMAVKNCWQRTDLSTPLLLALAVPRIFSHISHTRPRFPSSLIPNFPILHSFDPNHLLPSTPSLSLSTSPNLASPSPFSPSPIVGTPFPLSLTHHHCPVPSSLTQLAISQSLPSDLSAVAPSISSKSASHPPSPLLKIHHSLPSPLDPSFFW